MDKAWGFGRKEEAGGKRADVFVYQSMRSLVMILTTSSSSTIVWPVGPSNALVLSLILRKVTTAQLRQRILARKRSLALRLISLLSNPTMSVYIYGMTNALERTRSVRPHSGRCVRTLLEHEVEHEGRADAQAARAEERTEISVTAKGR